MKANITEELGITKGQWRILNPELKTKLTNSWKQQSN